METASKIDRAAISADFQATRAITIAIVAMGGEGGTPPPFIPVKPIARLAMAPAAVPGLIEALQGAVKAQKDAQAQA